MNSESPYRSSDRPRRSWRDYEGQGQRPQRDFREQRDPRDPREQRDSRERREPRRHSEPYDPAAAQEHKQRAIARALEALRTLERVHALPPALSALLHLAPPERHEAVVSMTERGAWISAKPLEGERGAPVFEAQEVNEEHVREVVRLVDRSEQEGRLPFLALTFFRDRMLPRWGGPWTRDDRDRQVSVESAIQRGWLRSGQVPNPKNPSFPTTSIELERANPDVQRILGALPEGAPARPETEPREDEQREEEL